MEIDENITFKKLVYKLNKIRHEYDRVLCLFKCYEVKERIKYRKETRDKIFSLKIEYWQKERCWDYINHDEKLSVLKEIAKNYR